MYSEDDVVQPVPLTAPPRKDIVPEYDEDESSEEETDEEEEEDSGEDQPLWGNHR